MSADIEELLTLQQQFHANQLLTAGNLRELRVKEHDAKSLYKLAFKNIDFLEKEVDILKQIIDNSALSYEIKALAMANLLFDAVLLVNFAKHYHDAKKSKKYNDIIAGIIKSKPTNSVEYSVISISKIRDFLWFLNGYRLIGVFSKLTVMELIELFGQYSLSNYFSNLYKFLNTQAFDHVTTLLNFCSVGIYGVTSMSHILAMCKHLLADSESIEATVSFQERFNYEIWKRHWRLGNDGFWAIINLFTNYAHKFGLSASFANQLTALFVLLDLVWLYRSYYVDNYVLQEQIKVYQSKVNGTNLSDLERELYKEKLKIAQSLKSQNDAVYTVFATSAALYITGFCFALVFAESIPLVTLGFFLCTLAMSLSLSFKAIVAFNFAEPDQRYDAGLKMTAALTENIVVPLTIMTLCSISLPAAALCVIAYLYLKYEKNIQFDVDVVDGLKVDEIDDLPKLHDEAPHYFILHLA